MSWPLSQITLIGLSKLNRADQSSSNQHLTIHNNLQDDHGPRDSDLKIRSPWAWNFNPIIAMRRQLLPFRSFPFKYINIQYGEDFTWPSSLLYRRDSFPHACRQSTTKSRSTLKIMAATAAATKQLQQLADYLETMRLLTVSSARLFATYLKPNTWQNFDGQENENFASFFLTESRSVASSVLFVYDYFITLGMEIDLIWFSPWTPTKAIYLIQRYLPFIDTVWLCLHRKSFRLLGSKAAKW